MINLQAIPVFTAVVEEGSFSAAAKRLNLTQPTVSFHIDNLEKSFGCPLFFRNAKGVSLTSYGETFYQRTQQIQAIVDQTQSHIQHMIAGDAGQIMLGASTIPGEYILPPLLAGFLEKRPGIRISLKTGDSGTILAAFLQHKFPLAIIGSKPPADIHSVPLWDDELVLIAHPDLAHTLPSSFGIEHLAKTPLVVREYSSGTRDTFVDALQANGIALNQCNIALEVGGNEPLKSAILHKIGIGFISRWAVRSELDDGRLCTVPIANFRIVRHFYAIAHQPLYPTCVTQFWEHLLANSNHT